MVNEGALLTVVLSSVAQSSSFQSPTTQAASSGNEGVSSVGMSDKSLDSLGSERDKDAGANPNSSETLIELLPEMVNQLNQTSPTQHHLHFSVAELSGKTVIEVTDQKTGDVIRQIPSEEAIAFSEHWAKTQQLLSPFSV